MKITNPTTAPVPVATQGTVTVAPVGGTMRVGVEGAVTVTAPNNAPVPVKIGDTVAVAQQGTVTVAPSGGEMRVTPAGGEMRVVPAGTTMPVSVSGSVTVAPSGGSMPVSGTVALSGTPTVTLAAGGNTVTPAGTPFLRSYPVTFMGGAFGLWVGLGDTVDYPTELQGASVLCDIASGEKLIRLHLIVRNSQGDFGIAIPTLLQLEGHSDVTDRDFFVGTVNGTYHLPAGKQLALYMMRNPVGSGDIGCTVLLSGREYR